jgi:hypothetical protein
MTNRPSTPEIITVNSEALETQIRDLLPSQAGFGSELQASNIITPIIDLTAAAEGSGLPIILQSALAFGSQTAFNVTNTTTTIINSTGFWRVTGVVQMNFDDSPPQTATISMSDGSSTKTLYNFGYVSDGANDREAILFDLTFFNRAGDSIIVSTSSSSININGSFRQIATGDGTLVQPNGFPL